MFLCHDNTLVAKKNCHNFHVLMKQTHTQLTENCLNNDENVQCLMSVSHHVVTVSKHSHRRHTGSPRNASCAIFPQTSSKHRLVWHWLRRVHHLVRFRFSVCRRSYILSTPFTGLHVSPVNFEASYPRARC